MKNHIVVNARFLTQRVTGVQRFAIELSRRIKKLNPSILFVSPKGIVNHSVAEELKVTVVGKMKGHLWEQLELPLYLLKNGSPLLINLANTAPLFYDKKIVTIHDLAFKVNPKWFSKTFSAYYNYLIPKIALNSLAVITVSESVKSELVELLHISDNKILVIYNAAGIRNSDISTQKTSNLPSKYILAVSSLDARKNFIRLINAFQQVYDKQLKLVLIGGSSKIFNSPDLHHLIKSTNNLISLGYVTDDELSLLYKNATAFIYPSLYEGFGIPTIESMAHGCPVISSDIEVMREVCGDAALYFDPLREEDITSKINLICKDKLLQDCLRQKGFKQSNKYCWDKSANQLINLITASLRV